LNEVEVRWVKFLEYQAKEVFAAAGIPTPQGKVAATAERLGPLLKSWVAPSSSRPRCPLAAGAKPGALRW